MDGIIVVNDRMQKNYRYRLVEPVGKNFQKDFKPELTPKLMLEMGVFGGKYLTDCQGEFPRDWFAKAKLSPKKKNPDLNYFKVDASLPLAEWQKRGWIYQQDPRGWFQWYARYFLGRRLGEIDLWQIKRWKAMRRHVSQVKKYCRQGDINCRRKQRQALLHWAYDSRKL